MTAAEVLQEVFGSIVPVGGLLGFATGTGFVLFAWMVRQPYRIFRQITGVGVGA